MEEELGDLWGEVEGVEGAIQARADAIIQAELDAWNALDAEERRRRTFEREKQALEAKILKAEVDAANRKLGIEPDVAKKKKRDGDESEEEEAPEDEGEVDFVRRLRKRHAKTQRRSRDAAGRRRWYTASRKLRCTRTRPRSRWPSRGWICLRSCRE